MPPPSEKDGGIFSSHNWKRFQYFEQKKNRSVVQGVELFKLQKK